MRIVHVSDFYLPRLGGIEQQISALVERQTAEGHTVDVVTATAGRHHAHARPAVIRAATATVLEGSYDVVHVHAGLVTPLSFAVAAASSRHGLATAVTSHSMVSYLRPAFRLADLAAHWTQWPVAWSAVSQVAAEPVLQLLRGSGPVDVLPNAVDGDLWRVEPLPRDPNHVVLASVMRLAMRKRPGHMLRMLREVRRRVPEAIQLTALVIGEGPGRASLARYLARHRMEGWVHLLGRLDHAGIREVYRRADLFVAPGNLESFGIAALEARTAGIPVVAKAGTGIAEFIRHGREGVLAADDGDMVRALIRLSRDRAARVALARHNRTVRPSYDWPTTLDRATALYRRAASLQGVELPGDQAARLAS